MPALEIPIGSDATPLAANEQRDLATAESVEGLFTEATPTPNPTPKQPEPKEPDLNELKVPKILLTDEEDEKPPVDEYEELNKAPTKGQIKHENFERYKELSMAKVGVLTKEANDLRAELERHKAQPLPEAERERIKLLEETNQKLTEQMERHDYQNSPRFHEKFTKREQTLRDQIKAIGKDYTLEDSAVEGILSAKGRRRDEIVDALEVSESARGRINGYLKDLDLLDSDRKEDLGQSAAQMKTIKLEDERKARADEEALRQEDEQTWNKALEQARTKLAGFRKEDGNGAWNKRVEDNEAHAKKYFSGQCSPEEVAHIALRGINSLMQDEVIKEMKKELNELRTANAALSGSGPKGGQAPGLKPNTSGMSRDDQVAANVAGLFQTHNNGFGG